MDIFNMKSICISKFLWFVNINIKFLNKSFKILFILLYNLLFI